jgi:hypothetical protein
MTGVDHIITYGRRVGGTRTRPPTRWIQAKESVVMDLSFIVERALTVAFVVSPVALVLLILSGVAARELGEAIPVSSGRADANVPEEDPAPRWRPELARTRWQGHRRSVPALRTCRKEGFG